MPLRAGAFKGQATRFQAESDNARVAYFVESKRVFAVTGIQRVSDIVCHYWLSPELEEGLRGMARRTRGTGSVFQRQDGRWCAQVDAGYRNGRRYRRMIYAWTRDEVLAQLDVGLPPARAQRPSGLQCETCRREFHPDDIWRGKCAGCYPWGALTLLGARHPGRPEKFTYFDCGGCGMQVWSCTNVSLCFVCDRAAREDWRVRAERMEHARAIGKHTEAEWTGLCAAHDGKCAYCGVRDALTKDHVVPVARGGSDLIENIAPACMPCNKRKGARPALAFLGGAV